MVGEFKNVIFRRDTLRAFFRVLRTDGPIGTWRRGVSFLRRTKAMASAQTAVGSDHPFPLIQFWSEMAQARVMSPKVSPALLTRQRVIAMIGDMNLPQCKKYRIEQLTELWGAVGVDYRYSHFEDIPRCLDIMQGATHLMLYRLHRHDLVTNYLYEARRLRLPILYDIDDPLFSVEAYSTYGNMTVLPPDMKQHFLRQAPLYLDVLNAADILSFSTPGLRDHAMSLSARPAFVRRNFADRDTLETGKQAMSAAKAKKAAAPGFTLCLASGSQGHEADFQIIAPQVEAFLDAAPDRKLLVLGHFRPELLSVGVRNRIEAKPFGDYATYLSNLARADAAVMPLADDLFNRCKSAVRVIDAAAVGVPAIVGPVGDMAAMIEPGRTGYLATGPEEWTTSLETLAADKSETSRMGQDARLVLEDLWSARASQPIVDPELVAWVKE